MAIEEDTLEKITLQDIIKKWDHFIKAVQKKPYSRNITREAWFRCKDIGMTPESISHKFLTDEELAQKREANKRLIEIVKPYMQQLSLSMLNIPHVVALSDSDGWIIDIEGDIDSFGGRSTGIEIGSSWSEKDIGNNGIGTALALGEPVFIYGIEHYGLKYKDVACFGCPIRDDNGDILGALDVSVITEYADPRRLSLILACIRSIEQTISNYNQTKLAVEPNDEDIQDLLATIVHDLKNPLTVIGAISQLGEMSASENKEKQYFNRIRSQIVELTNTVDALLAIRNTKDTKTKSNPLDIIKELVDELKPLCEKNNINLDLKDFNNTKVPLIPKLFKRVMYNLVMNSIKVIKKEGNILIEVIDNITDVTITVKDDGPGIPEEYQENIFEPFVSNRVGGTGIGLYMANNVIKENHNGDIWFESELGVGTTFFVSLPKEI